MRRIGKKLYKEICRYIWLKRALNIYIYIYIRCILHILKFVEDSMYIYKKHNFVFILVFHTSSINFVFAISFEEWHSFTFQHITYLLFQLISS